MDSAAAETIGTTLEKLRVVTCFYLGSFTLLAYDYFLTLPDEVEVVWGFHWTVSTPLFLLNRYIPFIDVSLAVYSGTGLNISGATCHALYSAVGWMVLCGLGISETILLLRTWAIWGKDKMIGYSLGILLAMSCVAMSIVLGKYLKSVKAASIDQISPILRGCLITDFDRLQYICFAIALGYESVILFLTLIKGVQELKTSKSHLVVSLYRYGILAYLLIFVSSVANVVVLLLESPAYANLLIVTQRVFHVVLINRILLSILRNALAVSLLEPRHEAVELQIIR
ncbi:hypothetical protein DENSPDRAFT_843611 [Dentipellis sp. KUC8613]|nr:hypothetical protein DENSPDRAFT_843611 [Dentipellis sp. KUC8613]